MKDIWRPDNGPYVPESVDDRYTGLRPSVARLIRDVDSESPAYAAVCEALLEMRNAGVELDESAVKIAIKLGEQRRTREERESAQRSASRLAGLPPRLWAEQSGKPSIVYYVLRGKLIKIGTTAHPEKRFRDMVPDEILAWEPGGRAEESFRHQQFAHLRQGGEYFRPARDLTAHCRTVRSTHGDPDPRWRTGARLAAVKSALSRDTLPTPTSPDLVTASQAASILGIKRSTIASWVRRRLLSAVDGRTRPLYYLDHIRALDQRRRAASQTTEQEGGTGEP